MFPLSSLQCNDYMPYNRNLFLDLLTVVLCILLFGKIWMLFCYSIFLEYFSDSFSSFSNVLIQVKLALCPFLFLIVTWSSVNLFILPIGLSLVVAFLLYFNKYSLPGDWESTGQAVVKHTFDLSSHTSYHWNWQCAQLILTLVRNLKWEETTHSPSHSEIPGGMIIIFGLK